MVLLKLSRELSGNFQVLEVGGMQKKKNKNTHLPQDVSPLW